jgi:hypothetical protein
MLGTRMVKAEERKLAAIQERPIIFCLLLLYAGCKTTLSHDQIKTPEQINASGV